jgi:hypothetical protein
MHSTQQPTETKRDNRGGIGLSFDGIPQQLLKRGRRTECRVCGFVRTVAGPAIEVLGRTGHLIQKAFRLCLCVAGSAPKAFLYFAAQVSRCAAYSVLVHGFSPKQFV